MDDWEDYTGPDDPSADLPMGRPQQAPQGGHRRSEPATESSADLRLPPGANRRPAPNVDNVANVDNRRRPFRPAAPSALFGHPHTAGQPTDEDDKAAHVDNVANVDNQGKGGGSQTEIDLALSFLDGFDAPSAPAAAPAPAPLPSPEIGRLRQGTGAAPSPVGGRQGPSPAAMAAVRRAARERLGQRAEREGVAPGGGARPSRSPRAVEGTTVSQATLEQYQRRGNLLFDRYRREHDIPSADQVSLVEWVNWLLALKPRLKSSTWRMYRQAAYHHLEGFPEADQALKLLDDDVIDRSRESKPLPADGPPPERLTSALKEKRFPKEDFNRICTYLRAFNRSKMAPVLVDWLRAGILTGLRPVEWRTTDLEILADAAAPGGRRAWLYVLNAKATNGRGNGIVRTLDLSSLTETDLAVVRRMVERGRDWLESGRFADIQGQCSALLYAATNKIWDRRRYAYALYSTRHQAIANWKAHPAFAGRPESIAALVGHGVTATSAEHYGKRRSAWPLEEIPAPPQPVPEELSMVRARMRLFEQRLRLEQEAGLRPQGAIPEYPVG